MPELDGPTSQRTREAIGGTGVGDPGQKPLDMPIAIGPAASGEEGEGIAAVATQIPGAAQSDDRKKEQGQQHRPQGGMPHPPEVRGRRSGGYRGLHHPRRP